MKYINIGAKQNVITKKNNFCLFSVYIVVAKKLYIYLKTRERSLRRDRNSWRNEVTLS